jgi:tetratricopeptide (TPR) repeat protein
MTRSRPPVNPAIHRQLLQVEARVKAQDYEGAAARLDAILRRHPADPYANFRAGWLCGLRGHYDQALDFFQRALTAARCPWSEAMNATGAILMKQGRYEEGYPFLEGAARAEPSNPDAWINLGNWAEGMGDDDLALTIYGKAARHHGYANAGIRWARSFIHLRRGDYRRGWLDYEARWLSPEWVAGRDRVFPPDSQFWYGEPLPPGDPLLVHYEQGQGDSVMALRYLPWLRSRTPARILLQVQDAILPLVRPLTGLYDQLLGQDDPLPAYTWHVSLMSLPHIHDTQVETIPPPLELAA